MFVACISRNFWGNSILRNFSCYTSSQNLIPENRIPFITRESSFPFFCLLQQYILENYCLLVSVKIWKSVALKNFYLNSIGTALLWKMILDCFSETKLAINLC